MKKWSQSDLRICKNEVSKTFKRNEKWGQLDRKSSKNWYKMCQYCQKTDFGEKIYQLYVQLSLDQNVIETK